MRQKNPVAGTEIGKGKLPACSSRSCWDYRAVPLWCLSDFDMATYAAEAQGAASQGNPLTS